MARSKRFNKLLRKLKNKEGSIFDTGGNLVGRGNINYIKGEINKLYLNDKQISINSIRSFDPCFNYNRALIFVNPTYKLSEKFN